MLAQTISAIALLLLLSTPSFAQSHQVLDYLYRISGTHTVAGAHNDEPNADPDQWTEFVKQATGKYPGLWSGDFLYQRENIDDRWTMIKEAKKQWDNGAIINIMWHACPPDQGEPCGWDPGVKGQLTDKQWQDLLTDGTALNAAWKVRMDDIAVYLQHLKDNGVEVLFRPLHEMNLDKEEAFWWSGRPGPNGTARLYRATHDYMVDQKGLTNLVWVWDMLDIRMDLAEYNPGHEYWEVFAFDVYGMGRPNGLPNGYDPSWYRYILRIVGDKPIALGECSRIPTPDMLAAQPRWTFFMPWPGLERKKDAIKTLLRDPRVITLDEMPGWNATPQGH